MVSKRVNILYKNLLVTREFESQFTTFSAGLELKTCKGVDLDSDPR